MTEQPKQPSKIQCSIRCLNPETVAEARRELGTLPAARIPYLCKISGEQEQLVLLSESTSRELAAQIEGFGAAAEVAMAAALLETSLCECDLATLMAIPESECLDLVQLMLNAGLIRHTATHGMNYYSLTRTPATAKLKDMLEAFLS